MKISFTTYGNPCTFAGRHTRWVATVDGVPTPSPNTVISESARFGPTTFNVKSSYPTMNDAKHAVIAHLLGGGEMTKLYAKFGHYANNPAAVVAIINHVSK